MWRRIRALGLTPHPIVGTERQVVAVVGHTTGLDPEDLFGTMSGVAEALRVSQPFKLVSREVKEEDTVLDVGGVPLGGKAIAVIAGPCSVESKDQILETAFAVQEGGGSLPARRGIRPAHQPVRVPGVAGKKG